LPIHVGPKLPSELAVGFVEVRKARKEEHPRAVVGGVIARETQASLEQEPGKGERDDDFEGLQTIPSSET
jgi:hypothetical protein